MNRKQIIEFGDFQTPNNLAKGICNLLLSEGINPKSIIEPTCGRGSFLINSIRTFSNKAEYLGIEINNNYLKIVKEKVNSFGDSKVTLINADFFQLDWKKILSSKPEPILIIGNPPWVTNSKLGSLKSDNLPEKSNFNNYNGIEALTGKSNFDISEWMIIHLLEWIQHRNAILAMLCKTSVARKVLRHVWINNFQISKSDIYIIDSQLNFKVSVDACLLVCKTGKTSETKKCNIYESLSNNKKIASIGIHKSELIADIFKYKKWSHLSGKEYYKWRSGVKHDSSRIMEFTLKDDIFFNGLSEICNIEKDYLYPLLKSSDIANGQVKKPRKWVLITQKKIGDETSIIKHTAPKTWNYLLEHSDYLNNRKSSIYKGKARFSIFGIGDYSFSKWKVAISSLYKKINFSVIPPYQDKPCMLDDTCNMIPCKTEDEANLVANLLNSEPARDFFTSFIFWDSKRPITISILKKIDLMKLAKELGKQNKLKKHLSDKIHSEEIKLSFFDK